MKRALVLLLAACGEHETVCGDGTAEDWELCDDGNRALGDGCDNQCQTEPGVRLTWAFYPMLGGTEQAGCRAGVVEIEAATDAPSSQRFPCDDGRTATVFIANGGRVITRLRDANNDIIAEALPQRALGASFSAPFYEDAGYLRILTRACTQPVMLTVTPTDGTPAFQQQLACQNVPFEALHSRPIRAGTYDVKLAGAVVATETAVVVGANNAVTELSYVAP